VFFGLRVRLQHDFGPSILTVVEVFVTSRAQGSL
jgi:hypothetical protein